MRTHVRLVHGEASGRTGLRIQDEGSCEILGAPLVGPDADEVINLFGLAIRHGLTATDLKRTIFAYPTAVGHRLHALSNFSAVQHVDHRAFGHMPA
jgi:pyruvate/2-oxoglutarate dehydrogenase complex dihydrolipoamide dehydrogenase (E3) component